MSSSSNATGSHDIIHGSHDVTHGSHDITHGSHDDINGSCDTSDAVTTETEDTFIQGTTNLKQFDVDRGMSGSHDSKDDSSTAEDSSHDPDRSTILNKIYQKYIRDRVTQTADHKTHRHRKKKVLKDMFCFHIIILLTTEAQASLHTAATPTIRYGCHGISCF